MCIKWVWWWFPVLTFGFSNCCEQPARKTNNFTFPPKNKNVLSRAKLRPSEHVRHRVLWDDLLTKISNTEWWRRIENMTWGAMSCKRNRNVKNYLLCRQTVPCCKLLFFWLPGKAWVIFLPSLMTYTWKNMRTNQSCWTHVELGPVRYRESLETWPHVLSWVRDQNKM